MMTMAMWLFGLQRKSKIYPLCEILISSDLTNYVPEYVRITSSFTPKFPTSVQKTLTV
jgi:hypothetical protein